MPLPNMQTVLDGCDNFAEERDTSSELKIITVETKVRKEVDECLAISILFFFFPKLIEFLSSVATV